MRQGQPVAGSARRRTHGSPLCRIREALLLLAFVGWSASAAAQPTRDGQIGGAVRDATGGVLVGANVVLASPQLIRGALELTTAEDGSWRASTLPPGVYDLTVTHRGFQAARVATLVLTAGQTLAVDVEMRLAGIVDRQPLEVVGPLVDVRSSAVATNIGLGLLRALPTSRTIADLLNLVPGVTGDMAYGGTKLSNGLYVDGVDTTEPAEQGPWLRYNQNWLQEVQVVGLGADAEHGTSTGVNAYGIVHAGGNRYAGLAEYWTTQAGWLADNTRKLSSELSRGFEPRRIDAFWNVNGQLGGPVRHERLWFFAGVERITDDRAPAGYDGPVLEQEDETRALAKLTAAPTDTWRIDGFLQGGRRRVLHAGVGPLVAPEATTIIRQPQTSWSTRALGPIGPALVLDVRYGGYVSPRINEPLTSGGPPGHYDLLTGVTSVNALTSGGDERRRHLVSATGTWYPGHTTMRSHELKFGVQSEWARERTTFEYAAGQVYYDLGSAPYLCDTFTTAAAAGVTRHIALFVQDRWNVRDGLTLLPGLRIDSFQGSTSEATGVLRTNPASARLGVAWDPWGSHRTVVRAHYGRYSDPVFAQPVLLTDFARPGLTITETLNAAGEWEEASRRSAAGSRRVDPGVKHSHVDQVIVGIERQLLRDVTVQTHYIHRAFGNLMGFAYENAIWTPVQRRDPGPDGLTGTPDDGHMVTVYDLSNASVASSVYTNPDGAWRRYDGWQLIASRRHAGDWQVQASYTRARAHGTIGQGFHTNAGRGDLSQGNGGNPNRLINGDGRSPHDPTHEAKLLGFWQLRWLPAVRVAGVYRYVSGAAWGRTFRALGLAQGFENVLAEPRGTRRVEAVNNLDLRVEATLPLGGRRHLSLFGDVFNVTNQGAPDSDWVTPVFTISGPSLGLPTVWRQARHLRVSMRFTY